MGLTKKIFIFAVLFFMLLPRPLIAADDKEIHLLLENVKERVEKAFSSIDVHLQKAAKKLSIGKANPFLIKETLTGVKSSAPYLASCVYVDDMGIIKEAVPQDSKAENTDISYQEHVRQVKSQKKPVMSRGFHAVEGYDACAIHYPVMDKNNFLGSISVLIRPEILLNLVVENVIKDYPVNVWLMQPDGRILYDKDNVEIGKDLFTDDYYKTFSDLQRAGKLIVSVYDGTSEYDFYAKGTKNVVHKKAYWTTLDLYGTQWKIILTSNKN